MVLPALLRTVNQQTSWPGRTKVTFICCAVLAALLFIGITALLAPEIGNYAAPVGMIAGLAAALRLPLHPLQNGPDRIAFPYREVGTALARRGVILGAGYAALPSLPLGADLAIARRRSPPLRRAPVRCCG